MGVLNQFAHFVKDYGKADSPAAKLHALNSTKVPFSFTTEHGDALEQIRETILSGVHLYAPRHDLPLHLETDGSEDGWGAVFFQIIDGERHVIKMWSKKWTTEAWMKKPPYHRSMDEWYGTSFTVHHLQPVSPRMLYRPQPLDLGETHFRQGTSESVHH